jgi:hypothetical protein
VHIRLPLNSFSAVACRWGRFPVGLGGDARLDAPGSVHATGFEMHSAAQIVGRSSLRTWKIALPLSWVPHTAVLPSHAPPSDSDQATALRLAVDPRSLAGMRRSVLQNGDHWGLLNLCDPEQRSSYPGRSSGSRRPTRTCEAVARGHLERPIEARHSAESGLHCSLQFHHQCLAGLFGHRLHSSRALVRGWASRSRQDWQSEGRRVPATD